MTWTKVGDEFLDRPDLLEVSRSARLLLLELYLYANRHLTDGYVKASALRRATDSDDVDLDLKELIEAQVLQVAGTGYQLDWTQQESGDRVLRRREQHKERQARYRAHKSGDHSLCDPGYCKGVNRDVTRHSTRDGRVGMTPAVTEPRPDQSRSGPEEPERRYPARHKFVADGSGLSCEECNLPQRHRIHDA